MPMSLPSKQKRPGNYEQESFIIRNSVAIAAVLAAAVIILANTTFTSLRLDLTENKLFTLSEGTLNIIQGLDEPVTLDYYVSKKLMADVPQLQSYATRVHDLLDEYVAKSNDNIRLNVIEPEPFSEEEDRAVGEGMQVPPSMPQVIRPTLAWLEQIPLMIKNPFLSFRIIVKKSLNMI